MTPSLRLIARGVSPLLVTLISVLLLGERLTTAGLFAVAFISLGLIALAIIKRGQVLIEKGSSLKRGQVLIPSDELGYADWKEHEP